MSAFSSSSTGRGRVVRRSSAVGARSVGSSCDVVLHVGRERDRVIRVRSSSWTQTRCRRSRCGSSARSTDLFPDTCARLNQICRLSSRPDDRSHGPGPLGDLVLHDPGQAVVEIQMVPTIPLRHPAHFLAVAQLPAKFLAGVEKNVRLFRCARRAPWRLDVNLDDAVD